MVKNLVRAAILAALMWQGSPRPCAAATTTLATKNDYYYTVPRSDNIAGRVMGENGDYSIVRYEDAAWITEAWYERLALGNSRSWQTNNWTFGALVRGEPWSWREAPEETSDYWTKATLQTCAVARYEEDLNTMLAAASGGEMTNRTRRMEAMLGGKLVSKAAITNAYAMLKGMNVVVKSVEPKGTNSADYVYEGWSEEWLDGRKIDDDTYNQIGRVDCVRLYRRGVGWKEVSKGLIGEDLHTWVDKGEARGRNEGSGRVIMEFWTWDKENWLRGEESPKVVESVHAYGRVEVEGSRKDEYEGHVYDEDGDYEVTKGWNRVESTNATILVDLGVPQWKEAKREVGGDYLVYKLEMRPAELLATCVAAAPWLPSIKEVDAVSVPDVEDEEGIRNVEKRLQGGLREVYLVMKLKPVTSLPGW